jgi:hypothetical protein
MKKFILSHDVVPVSVETGIRTENTAASAAMRAAADVHEM